MQEYLSDAIVLSREPNGDLDCRFRIFTKKYGKLAAKAKSVRKVTSKLAGHLVPGNVVSVRVVEKNGPQIVDALKSAKVTAANPRDLYLLAGLLADSEPDIGLWNLICGGKFGWLAALKILGWDPAHAVCGICRKGEPAVFDAEGQEFFCDACASKLPPDKLIYIGNAA
jgi:recombinational DNA repair protein (RecF pathway)